jgi:hypothetical protein
MCYNLQNSWTLLYFPLAHEIAFIQVITYSGIILRISLTRHQRWCKRTAFTSRPTSLIACNISSVLLSHTHISSSELTCSTITNAQVTQNSSIPYSTKIRMMIGAFCDRNERNHVSHVTLYVDVRFRGTPTRYLTEPFTPPSANWQHRDPETGSVAMATPHRFRGRKAEPRNLQSLLSLSLTLLDTKYHFSISKIKKWLYLIRRSKHLHIIMSCATNCSNPSAVLISQAFAG